MNRLAFIDVLKGLAVLMVVLLHLAQPGRDHLPEWLFNTIGAGEFGVPLFFMVSAFTLMNSFEHNNDLIRFYSKRAWRIFPLYLLAFVFYGLIGHKLSIRPAFLLNPYLPGYAEQIIVPGGWSISVEIAFYLWFPLIFQFTRKALVPLFLLSLLGNYLFYLPLENPDPFYPTLLSHLPDFLLGILCYRFYKGNLPAWLFYTLLAVLLITGFLLPLPHLPFLFVFALLFILLKNREKPVWGLSFLGRISYSYYLSHFVFVRISELLIPYTGPDTQGLILRLLLTFPLSIVFASLVFRFLETPLGKLQSWLGKYPALRLFSSKEQ